MDGYTKCTSNGEHWYLSTWGRCPWCEQVTKAKREETVCQQAIALLREWGTTYDDPKYAGLPDYGARIREFLERVDSQSDAKGNV